MFIDEAEIYVRGGKGGQGCVSFRREKFVPKGGPDGGDGGDGGSVIFHATRGKNTLLDFARGERHWVAQDGRPGLGSNCFGRKGQDRIIHVPVGTLLYDRDRGVLLKDLQEEDQTVCIAKGGIGGKGNRAFMSPSNQAPRKFGPGTPGEERWLRLELKLIADVGLVGLPNAGKSTLLSHVSRARPKIASYPFTTLTPVLGIIELRGYRRFVMADIPGLIEGAHKGVGLGDTFLKHIERTRILLHLLDVNPMDGSPEPAEAYRIIREELGQYSAVLLQKREIVVANKTDLIQDDRPIAELRDRLGTEVIGISGATGAGLDRLTNRLWDMIEADRQACPQQPEPILGPPPHARDQTPEEPE